MTLVACWVILLVNLVTSLVLDDYWPIQALCAACFGFSNGTVRAVGAWRTVRNYIRNGYVDD